MIQPIHKAQKLDEGQIKEIKEIIGGQAVIDEIVVKNNDDIALIKKAKEKNYDLIKSLETKIDTLDKEVKKVIK